MTRLPIERTTTPTPASGQLLHEAFERFTEASAKLQEKYAHLLGETEMLRQKLKEKDLEVKRAERLSMLGETAAALAHEVRNPLGAIKLFLSLLAKETAELPVALELVNQINVSVSTLDNLVGNILHFSKEKPLLLTPINIHSVIQEQSAHFRHGAHPGSTIELSLHGSPFVMGNECTLRQVFYNLILNGLQATRSTGKITIATADQSDGTLLITVSDNGPGIPEHVLGKIFDPFVTTKIEGTGLGLAIVRQILVQHGATIAAHNDGGARITIVMPRTGKEA